MRCRVRISLRLEDWLRTTMNAQPTLHVEQKSTLTTVPSSTHLYPDTENIVPHNGCDSSRSRFVTCLLIPYALLSLHSLMLLLSCLALSSPPRRSPPLKTQPHPPTHSAPNRFFAMPPRTQWPPTRRTPPTISSQKNADLALVKHLTPPEL